MAIDLPPGIDRDAQNLAKALVLSMHAEGDRSHPGPRTCGLVWSSFDGLEKDLVEIGLTEEQARKLEKKIMRVWTTITMLADIGAAAVSRLDVYEAAIGPHDGYASPFRDQLVTPYLMPEELP